MVGRLSQEGNGNQGKSVSFEQDCVLERINKIEPKLKSFWWRVVKECSIGGVGILLPTLKSDWDVERELCNTVNTWDISGNCLIQRPKLYHYNEKVDMFSDGRFSKWSLVLQEVAGWKSARKQHRSSGQELIPFQWDKRISSRQCHTQFQKDEHWAMRHSGCGDPQFSLTVWKKHKQEVVSITLLGLCRFPPSEDSCLGRGAVETPSLTSCRWWRL